MLANGIGRALHDAVLSISPLKASATASDARHRSDDALTALAESIADIGLLNPIRVRPDWRRRIRSRCR